MTIVDMAIVRGRMVTAFTATVASGDRIVTTPVAIIVLCVHRNLEIAWIVPSAFGA